MSSSACIQECFSVAGTNMSTPLILFPICMSWRVITLNIFQCMLTTANLGEVLSKSGDLISWLMNKKYFRRETLVAEVMFLNPQRVE